MIRGIGSDSFALNVLLRDEILTPLAPATARANALLALLYRDRSWEKSRGTPTALSTDLLPSIRSRFDINSKAKTTPFETPSPESQSTYEYLVIFHFLFDLS